MLVENQGNRHVGVCREVQRLCKFSITLLNRLKLYLPVSFLDHGLCLQKGIQVEGNRAEKPYDTSRERLECRRASEGKCYSLSKGVVGCDIR